MHEERDQQKDEQWIRDVCTQYVPSETLYVRHEYYDGGYEVRVGSYTFFIEYEVIDASDEAWIAALLKKGGLLL